MHWIRPTLPAHQQVNVTALLALLAGAATFFGLTLIGLGIAGGETVKECTGHLMWKKCHDVRKDWSSGTVAFLIVTGSALVLSAVGGLVAAWKLRLRKRHLRRYEAILTGVESMTIQRIAHITNSQPAKVRAEIQSMIDSDMISDFYIDYGADKVVSRKYVPKTSHKTVVRCSECGANNEVIVGITRHCSFCRQPLLLGAE